MEIGKKPPPPALPPLRSPQVGQHRKAKTSKSYLGRPAWTRHTCPPQKRGAPDFSAAGIDPLLRRTEPGSECADRLAVGRNPGSAISLRLCSPGGPNRTCARSPRADTGGRGPCSSACPTAGAPCQCRAAHCQRADSRNENCFPKEHGFTPQASMLRPTIPSG